MSLYSAFLPRDRRTALQRRELLPDRVTGAALLADLSGFTRLTASLAEELGPRRGAEALVGHLDRVFTLLISAVHAYDGDVILFNGDAVTCWFADGESPDSTGSTAAVRATRCALAMQEAMSELASVTTPAGTVIPLAIKVGIAAGPARRFLLGDSNAYVIESLAGRTLDRMARAEELAARGDVMVSAEVAAQLPSDVHLGERQGTGDEEYVTVLDWSRSAFNDSPDEPARVADEQAQCWLLPPVARRLSEGSEAFLAELRPTVSVFLGFSGIDYDADDAAGEKLNQFVIAAQAILDRYEGYLVQVTMGDKGSLFYISFGAPLAHEDDSLRAAAAALDLLRLGNDLPFLSDLRIGISRGVVYSGAYGSPERRTYSLLGGEVNVAARLMTTAEPGTILVSGFVAEDIEGRFELEEMPPVAVKGIDHPFEIWNLRRARTHVTDPAISDTEINLVGRDAEQAILGLRLDKLFEGESGNLILKGAAGVGKSVLIADLLRQARAASGAQIEVLIGSGNAIEQATPYLAWQSILQELVDRVTVDDGPNTGESAASQLEAWLDPEVRYLAPLLNPLLPFNYPETQLTAQMTGEARLLSTQELVVSMLRKALGGRPLLLIFDDAQWLDSLSTSLMRRISREIAPLLLVLSLRTGAEMEAATAVIAELHESAATSEIVLDTLPVQAAEQLVKDQLNTSIVDPKLVEYIYAKAEGHPYFSVELVNGLRDAGLLEVGAGRARFVTGSDAAVMEFPDTIQGVITSRIDRLGAPEQMTAKVASVIGRVFAYRVLRDVYPTAREAAQIRSNLSALEQREITAVESIDPELTYLFRHIVTQEVIYGLMTSAQRQQLHERIAVWYERVADPAESRYAPLLAYHWSRAGDQTKATIYYAAAGESAFREYANEEAMQFLSEAVRLGREFPVRQRARWHRLLGEAAYRLTRVEESSAHFQEALSLLGHPVPSSTFAVGSGLVGALLRQVANRQLPPRAVPSDPDELETLRESALAYDRVSELYYNTGDELTSFYSVISALNLAEAAGPSPELVRGYANMCSTLATVSLTSLANGYRERALALARDIDHLPTSAWININFSVYSLWYGQWERALAEIAEAMTLHAQLGDWRLWCVAAWLLPQVSTSIGDLALAGQQWADIYETAVRREDSRHQVRASGGQFFNNVATGDAGQSADLLAEVGSVLEAHPEMLPLEERLWYGMQARHALEQGDYTAARDLTNKQVEAIKRARFKYDLLDVFAGPVDVRLKLLEADEATAGEAKEGLKLLGRFARTYPFARARALRYEGNYEWLAGSKSRAERSWQKSIAQADALVMPLEKALTMEAISSFSANEQAAAQAATIRAELAATSASEYPD